MCIISAVHWLAQIADAENESPKTRVSISPIEGTAIFTNPPKNDNHIVSWLRFAWLRGDNQFFNTI